LISKPIEGPDSKVRTVPSEVEDKALPAANECRSGKPNIGVRRKDRAMGVRRPVKAMQRDSGRRAVKVSSEVEAPPDI
jgi:hypothetical protein